MHRLQSLFYFQGSYVLLSAVLFTRLRLEIIKNMIAHVTQAVMETILSLVHGSQWYNNIEFALKDNACKHFMK